MKQLLFLLLITLLFQSCSENYSNGERVGVITQFSNRGLVWKSWEGHLNATQTGMNSAAPFDFSIDNDVNDETLIRTIDSAATFGWIVKLIYHEVVGYNWFKNRGDTDFFVVECRILDRNTRSQHIYRETPVEQEYRIKPDIRDTSVKIELPK